MLQWTKIGGRGQQEMDLRREELELSKARFELKRKEREALIEEKNERRMMYEMMKTLLNRK